MLQLEKDLLEIQLQVSKWQPVIRKIMNPLYGYIQCSYLFSNASTYLDTNYMPNTETKLDIKFKLNNTENNNICFSDNFGIGIRDSKLAYMFGDEVIKTDLDVSVDAVYEVQLSKYGLFVNGLQVVNKFSTDIDFVSDKTLLLGAGYNNDDIAVLNSKNIYCCKVYDVDEFDYSVAEDGNMIMSVLNQVNLVDDTFESFGGTDDEIKDTLDEVMNKPKTKSNIPDLVRNYTCVRTDADMEENYVYGFWNYADKKFYTATEGSYKGKDNIEYIELEYLQSSGTQYINTGVSDKDGLVLDCTFMLPSIYGTTWNTIVGAQDNADSNANGSNSPLMTYNDRTKFSMYAGTTNVVSNFAVATNTIYKATASTLVGNTYLTLNGTTQTFSNGGTRGVKPLYMFGLNNGGSLGYVSSSRIYNLKITNSKGQVVRNFIPVRRLSDGVLCMYDKVSETYFSNNGTGTFTAGPEKNDKMKDLNTTDLLLRLDKKSVISATQWYDRVSSKNITISNGTINTETDAINFNGTSTIVDTTVAQSNLTSGYTVVTRFYPTTWNNYKGVFGLHDTSGQNGIVGLQYQDSAVYFGHRNNGNYYVSVNASEKLSLNNWHTAVCKFDGTYLYLYLDGDYIGKTNNNTPLTATGNIIFGKSYNESNRFFAGQISDVLIYKRAITDNEINYIFTHIASDVVDLPYTELDYIQSSGSQFISIDYIPKTLHTKYELGFMRLQANGTWNPIINSEEDVRFGMCCTRQSETNLGEFWVGPTSNYKSVTFPVSDNVKYDIIADKTGISLNGTKYTIATPSDATGQWSTCINHRRTGATTFSSEYSIGRWYYLKIYEDDNLIKNFIPVIRKSDNAVCMYDKVSNTFFTNIGTGNFTAGPEK